MRLRVPGSHSKYLLEVEQVVVFVVSDWVVFLVVEAETGRVSCSPVVPHGVDEVLALIHHDFVCL